MRGWTWVLGLLFAGCDGGAVETGDSDVNADEPAACLTLQAGPVEVSGSCFGMTMTATLEAGADACTWRFTDWSMDHGGLPARVVTDAATVTVHGDGWDDCVGELDGTEASGLCGDGCAWSLRHE